MGLAASQARFLCITARKADCEYKSTDLAQQKLSITNQLAAVSNDYVNAMNATKLMWSNDTVDADYGLTYSLLMMPSAVNDYDPYMITTPSGAIVLNSEYAAAARAAGLSKAGGIGSQEQRDKFIQAMVPGGLVTKETADSITRYDFKAEKVSGGVSFEDATVSDGGEGSGVQWNPLAGIGAQPKNKSVVDAMQLPELIMSEQIGQQLIDWTALTLKDGQISKVEYDRKNKEYTQYSQLLAKHVMTDDIVSYFKSQKNTYDLKNKPSEPAENATPEEKITYNINLNNYNAELLKYNKLIKAAEVLAKGDFEESKFKELTAISASDSPTGTAFDGYATVDAAYAELKNFVDADQIAFKNKYSGKLATGEEKIISIDTSKFNVNQSDGKKIDFQGYSVVVNGVLEKDKGKVADMTIGDILAGSVVLVSNKNGGNAEDINNFKQDVEKMLDSIAKVFGYSPSEDLFGKGFNIDEASSEALKFAYNMTKRQFNRVTEIGSNTSNSFIDNTAYQNAINYNTIGTDSDKQYVALSLSNMLSSFLTYYDNYLNMANSDYVVGKSVEQSVYVTDNLNYYYMFQNDGDAVNDIKSKSADFYDELYNNILAHGWREDVAIDDSEYLESMIKDGRYSMSSLNEGDGYYYQSRYNDTGYIVEVADTDAIARAEAEFKAKKAELTYKEDSIDLKSKKLDAEISALTTEYESVKSMISNGVQKAFQLFQS